MTSNIDVVQGGFQLSFEGISEMCPGISWGLQGLCKMAQGFFKHVSVASGIPGGFKGVYERLHGQRVLRVFRGKCYECFWPF